ncbi:Borealin N terminal-domain-containing protein [Lasiosphaeris hirsuta]|uniref:Borealin N terminal-domain-containing protein n=1 Tax=Lasiosphaeris hirsuta TaxID=260670 RepID=A0AA40E762_9PEZI|nr:Borealin N terminal-domain-containing protein [Lasiosphaeris hirsuta]
MPPVRGKKRKSDQSAVSIDEQNTRDTASQKIPTKSGTPSTRESPLKKRKTDITLAQKEALIENLQLEIAERARKLRATYNIHAQSLRTRIEIRVNRIPLSLRKAKMSDLLNKYTAEQQQQNTGLSTNANRGPPVPEKDPIAGRPIFSRPPASYQPSPMRPPKRMSHDISGGDKENEVSTIDIPKKKARGNPATADIGRNPGQVLSPASSNSRIAPRNGAATPAKSGIARPVSPTKTAGSSILSNMVEKARSTRAAATARKTTTSTITSSSNKSAPTRAKRGAAATAAAPAPPPTRPATRMARRISGISESSDGSTSTVVRKRPATAMSTTRPPMAPSSRGRTVINSIKKGVGASTASKKPPALTKAAPASTAGNGTGRVLRKRT